jgi:hypothetical protein
VNPPPNAPPNTTSLAVVNVVFPVSVPTPPNVSVPLFVPSPIVTVPPSVSPFVANVRALVPSLETVPPLITNVPPPNAPLFPKYNAPAVTVTPPLNVFAPLNVSAPAPDFVTPNPPPNAPLNTNAFGLAGTVNVVAPPNVPAPLSVNAPVFVASPIVTAPPIVNPLLSVRAVVESLESVVPVAIVNTPVPKPAAFPTLTVPPFTVTPPLNVLAPLNVKTPEPAFVTLKPPPIAPLNVTADVCVNITFDVNIPAPLRFNVPVPTPSPSITAPPRLYALPNVRAVAESLANVVPVANAIVPVPSAKLFPTRTVPSFTVSPPENVLAPDKVNTPVPALIRSNAPLTTPLNVTALGVISVVPAEAIEPAPLKFSAPVLIVLPNVTAPSNEYTFENVRAVDPSLETAPPFNNSTPVPNAALFPAKTLPALTVVPPLYVFAPANTHEPTPDFVSEPDPVIAPFTLPAEAASKFEMVVAPEMERVTLIPSVNAPEPADFISPPEPKLSVFALAASKVTAFGDAMPILKTDPFELKLTTCAAVKPVPNSAVSAVVGTTPPSHDADALKSVAPWIHEIVAPFTGSPVRTNTTTIKTETARVNHGTARMAS